MQQTLYASNFDTRKLAIMKNDYTPTELWSTQKKKLLKKFSQLDESDFHYDYGMKNVMLDKLQVKLGKSRDELNALLLAL